ncbi:MAG: T9SS type A sorting domain-containing protein [Bacteroidales bacterium]|nr:T9SS type A sorting domain-containing protein [Bacteroidales bacterium]
MLKNAIILLLFISLCQINISAQNTHSLSIETSFRLYPGNVSQTEVFITNSPQNSNILFASCNTLTFIPFFVSEGIYVSTDGGDNWTGNDTCTGDPLAFHGGDPGIAIDKNGTFVLTRLGRSPFTGLYSHYSNDNGQTWSAQKVISTDDLERAVLASDIFPASPYYGRTYAAWVRFSPPYPMMMAYTDDGGITWSLPAAINNPPNRSAGGDICIGPGGEVYVCWAGVTDVSPFKEIHVGFASSANGGSSWDVNEEAFPVNGITGLLPEKGNIRVNGLPGIALDTVRGDRYGWIYIVTGQKQLPPAGIQPDIILNRSEDGGQSWSQAIRVTRDSETDENIQYFAGLHVDSYGGLNIIYYDDRNTTIDSTGVFLSRSLDGGNSWKEYEISDHNFKPEPIGGLGQGYQGDNIDITSTPDKLWPVWMDNISGIYQIWSVPINFSTLDAIHEPTSANQSIILGQNSPNPFQQQTSITYMLKRPSHVILKVFNARGQEVCVLIDEYQMQGSHELTFRSADVLDEAGIYFYTLIAGGEHITRKMLCLP